MKKVFASTLSILFLSTASLHAEELSNCVSSADNLYEMSSQKALDEHTIRLAELSIEKEGKLKNTFSLFSLKQSLSKMKEVREKYKELERKENTDFKAKLDEIRKTHDELLEKCDKLSEENSNTTSE